MKASDADTIVALSTPEGAGLRALLRISGTATFSILKQLSGEKNLSLESHRVFVGKIQMGETAIPASFVWMKGPRSYTREDMAEIEIPSSPALVRECLRQCLALGLRLAEPGEFTRRAFQNGRLDLTQAEGVLELIRSRNAEEAQAGFALLEGGLSSRIQQIRDSVESVLALLEASLDFEEGETGHIDAEELLRVLQSAMSSVEEASHWEMRRAPQRSEISVFLAGAPNAGKSSLLNRLDPKASAIVSPVAGTTRDCLVGLFEQGGLRFRLMDAAGIEESLDPLSQKAQELAARFRQSADLVLFVVDASDSKPDPRIIPTKVDLFLLNKTDLSANPNWPTWICELPLSSTMPISAKTGKGIPELKLRLHKIVKSGSVQRTSSQNAIAERHRLALTECLDKLKDASDLLKTKRQWDAVASSLRSALLSLDSICGESHNEGILDRIFSQFCIGK